MHTQDLRKFGCLLGCSGGWLSIDVSGLPIRPIFKDQMSKKKFAGLKGGM